MKRSVFKQLFLWPGVVAGMLVLAACSLAKNRPSPQSEPSTAPTTTPTAPTTAPTPTFLPQLHFPFLPADLNTSGYEAYLNLATGVDAATVGEDALCPTWFLQWTATQRPRDVLAWEDFLASQTDLPADYFVLSGERTLYSVVSEYDSFFSIEENFMFFGANGQVAAWSDQWFPFWQAMDYPTARQGFERYWLLDLTGLLRQASWSAQGQEGELMRYTLRWDPAQSAVSIPWAQHCGNRQILYGQLQNWQGKGQVTVTQTGAIQGLKLELVGQFFPTDGSQPLAFRAEVSFSTLLPDENTAIYLTMPDIAKEKGAVPPPVTLPPGTEFARQIGAPPTGTWWGAWTPEGLNKVRAFFEQAWPREGKTLIEATTASDSDTTYILHFRAEDGKLWEVTLSPISDTKGTSMKIKTVAEGWDFPATMAIVTGDGAGMAAAYCLLMDGHSDGVNCQWPTGEACPLAALLAGDCVSKQAQAWVWLEPAAPYCITHGGWLERADTLTCRFDAAAEASCNAWDYFNGSCKRITATRPLLLGKKHFSAQAEGRIGPGETALYLVPQPRYDEVPIFSGDLGFPSEVVILVAWLESPRDDITFTVYSPQEEAVAQGTANAGPVAYVDNDMTYEPFIVEIRGGEEESGYNIHLAWAAEIPDATSASLLPAAWLDADGMAYFYQQSRSGKLQVNLEGADVALGMYLLPQDGHEYKVILDPADGKKQGFYQDRGIITVLIVVQGPPGSQFQLQSNSYLR